MPDSISLPVIEIGGTDKLNKFNFPLLAKFNIINKKVQLYKLLGASYSYMQSIESNGYIHIEYNEMEIDETINLGEKYFPKELAKNNINLHEVSVVAGIGVGYKLALFQLSSFE